MHCLVVPEAFEGAVGEVYHAHVNAGSRGWVQGRRCLGTARFLAFVDDEQRTGVEAVGGLTLQDGFEAAQFVQDGLKKVPPQLSPIVHKLVKRMAEALN